MIENNAAKDKYSAMIKAKGPTDIGNSVIKGHWTLKIYDRFGNLKDYDEWDNIVVNAGLDHLLDVTLSGGTQDTTWFVVPFVIIF